MKMRADIALQYRVKLIGPDGAEWEWRITDRYFVRRLKKIGNEMLDCIRQHDLSYEFGLSEPGDRLSHLVAVRPENITEAYHRLRVPPPGRC